MVFVTYIVLILRFRESVNINSARYIPTSQLNKNIFIMLESG
ncbi:hypothetical protein JCM19298_1624 [Nonlabens ulvanivorans]|nr:hypothetical protein JCM19298_1624 [Nonlabens ulvanivorans]